MSREDAKGYDGDLIFPRRLQWCVISDNHWTKGNFGVGQVDRVTGFNVRFFGRPLGKEVWRVSSIWLALSDEDKARAIAATLSAGADRYNDRVFEAKIAFTALSASLGCRGAVQKLKDALGDHYHQAMKEAGVYALN